MIALSIFLHSGVKIDQLKTMFDIVTLYTQVDFFKYYYRESIKAVDTLEDPGMPRGTPQLYYTTFM